MMPRGAALQARLAAEVEQRRLSPLAADIVERIAAASARLARVIAGGDVPEAPLRPMEGSHGGDIPKPIDAYAHGLFRDALAGSAVAALLSEEAGEVEWLDATADLWVAMDPIDGSGNADLNVPLGTIFSIVRKPAGGDAAVIWPSGTMQLAAGFVLHGPQTTLILTMGGGVDLFTLDPDSRLFTLTRADIRIPPAAPDDYAVNASNYRHWDDPIRRHIDELVAGASGPYGRDFNMRWHGALVAEAHRIIMRGGLYLYPGDRREGYGNGRLRLIYEAYPIAFLVECAGGAATNGGTRILDIPAQSLHQRVPLVFGSKSMVDRLMAMHHQPGLWSPSVAPLFATRGLFRS